MLVLTPHQAAELDRKTIAAGLPGMALMETAGRSVVAAVRDAWPQHLWRGVVILCGPGNNGGDGLVCARVLARLGVPVKVFALSKEMRGDAAANQGLLAKLGIEVETDLRRVPTFLASRPLVIDALFGTGLTRPLEGVARALVDAVNQSGCAVAAIDIPSGVHGGSGAVLGTAMRAHLTVTFGTLKRGLLLYPGAAHAGRIRLADIGLLPYSETAEVELTERRHVAAWLPYRAADSNKGAVGRVLLIAGSPGLSGAAMLSARGAMRSGAGYVRLASGRSLAPLIDAALWEAVKMPLPDGGEGRLSEAGLDVILEAVTKVDAIAIGPGLGRHDDTTAAVRRLLSTVDKPTVIDADALYCLEGLKLASADAVLTPHPGEMGHLLSRPTGAVLADPLGSAQECSRRWGVTALLKGAHTVVASAQPPIRINWTGNAGMASAGMGDVLTGLVATLLSQGLDGARAAAAAAFIHGLAGDIAAASRGYQGLLATDVSEALPAALRQVRMGPEPAWFPAPL